MLHISLICVTLFDISTSLKIIPGQPLPHANILEDILSRYLGNTSYYDNSMSDIIQGISETANDTRDLNYKDDNLDVKVLDHNALKKVIHLVEARYAKQVDFRRRGREAYVQTPYVKNKCLDMMRQSIYYIKRRVNDTRKFRKKYQGHPSYHIAVLYGAAAAIITKMENLLAQMQHFALRTHFLWYLVIYEKLLSCNVDITNLLQRIFLIQQQFAILRGPKSNMQILKIDKSKYKNKDLPDDLKNNRPTNAPNT